MDPKKFDELRKLADRQIKEILQKFPPPLKFVAEIPILLEEMPSSEDVKEGVEFDVLGLFVGPTLAEIDGGSCTEASHILLFLKNIWDEAGRDENRFSEEVKITLLHELGHYLNWDETDLNQRGLG